MNTILKFEEIIMPAAELGDTSPIPDIKLGSDLHATASYDDSLSEEEAKYIGFGRVNGILPYNIQNNYNRERKDKAFGTVVLENEYLKAVFIPEFGGRLWSLYDKIKGKDLLYVNPVFQPANLALRDAWISGGVEWNIGMIGHTPYTLSPMFVSTSKMADGTPILRMYEWERIRQVSYCIDAFLPADSRFLFVKVTLENTTDHETPIYWWSNIAVPEADDVRVIAPADKAFNFDYKVVSKKPYPVYNGIDRSYSTRVKDSLDMFFDIDTDQRKWITAVDSTGYGLVQTSTKRLKGRKLFLWGNGTGGQHWQEFLSVPDHKYIEIQAGLCNTQLEHMPMPSNAKWSWLEAYGAIETDPQAVHGEDWNNAQNSVESLLEDKLPNDKVNDLLTSSNFDKLDFTIKSYGSGWGATQKELSALEGFGFSTNLDFPSDSMNESNQFWINLLTKKSLLAFDPAQQPAEFYVQADVIEFLEQASKTHQDWHLLFQLGVAYSANQEMEKAYIAFERSLRVTDNPWALVGMGLLESLKENYNDACKLMMAALEINNHISIAVEAAKAMVLSEHYDCFDCLNNLTPESYMENGRIKLAKAHCLVMQDRFDEALEILEDKSFVVNNIRESETSLSDLWILLHKRRLASEENLNDELALQRAEEQFPVPYHLDFRMKID